MPRLSLFADAVTKSCAEGADKTSAISGKLEALRELQASLRSQLASRQIMALAASPGSDGPAGPPPRTTASRPVYSRMARGLAGDPTTDDRAGFLEAITTGRRGGRPVGDGVTCPLTVRRVWLANATTAAVTLTRVLNVMASGGAAFMLYVEPRHPEQFMREFGDLLDSAADREHDALAAALADGTVRIRPPRRFRTLSKDLKFAKLLDLYCEALRGSGLWDLGEGGADDIVFDARNINMVSFLRHRCGGRALLPVTALAGQAAQTSETWSDVASDALAELLSGITQAAVTANVVQIVQDGDRPNILLASVSCRRAIADYQLARMCNILAPMATWCIVPAGERLGEAPRCLILGGEQVMDASRNFIVASLNPVVFQVVATRHHLECASARAASGGMEIVPSTHSEGRVGGALARAVARAHNDPGTRPRPPASSREQIPAGFAIGVHMASPPEEDPGCWAPDPLARIRAIEAEVAAANAAASLARAERRSGLHRTE